MAHTVAELRDYADEHLIYEIWMASALTQRMTRHAALFDGGLSASDGPLAEELLELPGRNADIESFATHVRNLVQFLYPNKPKPSDVIAANYFDKVSDWTGVRPDRPRSLMVANQRVPVGIGHLGFGRLGQKNKTWSYGVMWRDLATVIGVFLPEVPLDRVTLEFRNAAKALVSAASRPETLHDVVSEIRKKGLMAGIRATNTATSYTITDDSTRSSGGTETMLPKREPPSFGD